MIKIYYSNITNSEIQFFHGLTAPNFTITLTQLLESDLFKVETIKTNLYKIYPLFYTETITTNNPRDIVIDDQVILCQKQEEKETFLTFISNPDGDVQDYQNYASYYDIGDSLTENEYNSIVSLLRHNIINEDPINMLRDTDGDYGNYLFSVDGCTVLDTGLVVNDETRSAEPKVMLTDNVFHYSTYTLKLEVLHFTGVNVLDGDSGDYRVVDTLEIELFKDQWVNIPLEDLEENYIISLDAVVDIRHDKPEIHMITGLTVNGEPDIIQTGDSAEVYAQLIDYGGYPYNINDASGKTVYFFEQLTPSLTVTATPNPIQSGDTTDIYSTVKDSDGSKVGAGVTVYFYQKYGTIPTTLSVTADKSVLSYADSEKAVLTATLTGETVEGKEVVFKQGATVLDTVLTDENGEAEYEYSSEGVGDVTLTVECENITKTITIEDCITYDSLTSNSGKWTIPSGVTSQYSDNGWKVSANAYKQIKLTDKLTSACSVEFTVVDYYSSNMGSYPPVIVYQYTNGETTPNQLLLMNTSASAFTALTNTINHAMVKGAVYKIEYTSSTIKVYENGTLLATATNDVGLPTRFEFHMGANSRYATYKDLKIKPL